jgi:hypothetical protein
MPIIPISGSAVGRGALVPIARSVVTNTTTSDVTFNNIPQIYQDLMIVVTGRRTDEVTQTNLLLTPYYSGIPSSPQSTTLLVSDGVTVGTTRYSTQDAQFSGALPGALSQVGAFGSCVAHVLSYANTSNFKVTLFRSVSETTNSGNTRFSVGLTRGLSGLTVVNLSTFNGALFFVPGTTATVYGVRSINQ